MTDFPASAMIRDNFIFSVLDNPGRRSLLVGKPMMSFEGERTGSWEITGSPINLKPDTFDRLDGETLHPALVEALEKSVGRLGRRVIIRKTLAKAVAETLR
jgi:hypothetical protein